MNKSLGEIFKYNRLANLQLIEACRSLTDEQLDTRAPGTSGRCASCRCTWSGGSRCSCSGRREDSTSGSSTTRAHGPASMRCLSWPGSRDRRGAGRGVRDRPSVPGQGIPLADQLLPGPRGRARRRAPDRDQGGPLTAGHRDAGPRRLVLRWRGRLWPGGPVDAVAPPDPRGCVAPKSAGRAAGPRRRPQPRSTPGPS